MKIFLAFVALIGFLHAETALAEVPASLTPRQRHTQVRFQTLQKEKWTTHENVLTIEAAASVFGVDGSEMLCVAHRESGPSLYERAYNPSSGASGLFQHLIRYWPGRVAAYNHAMRHRPWLRINGGVFESRANALVAAWMIRTGGWGPWSGGCW